MQCPNCHGTMGPVQAQTHSGFPIIINQCQSCGGLWFDHLVFYSAKQGEAHRIENRLNWETLRAPKIFESASVQCPVEGADLQRFQDAYFPKTVHVLSCPKCGGFWLNRGDFIRFQEGRSLLSTDDIQKTDEVFHREIELMLRMHHEGGKDDSIAKLAKFLAKSFQAPSVQELIAQLPPTEERERVIAGLLVALFSSLSSEK